MALLAVLKTMMSVSAIGDKPEAVSRFVRRVFQRSEIAEVKDVAAAARLSLTR